MTEDHATVTIEVQWMPYPPVPVQLRTSGGFNTTSMVMWACASFELYGKTHHVWLDYAYHGEPFPYDLVRERVMSTMGAIHAVERQRTGGPIA